ncbi:hypothetical protein AB0K67_05220 [Nonomuraea sp. NPDC052634]|jgi:hypothetical protein|uniref:hypothetical protein n=1 Tax=Nonomuraea sp. NPDC052634 TaxID=3155813 RepID=UPI00342D3019
MSAFARGAAAIAAALALTALSAGPAQAAGSAASAGTVCVTAVEPDRAVCVSADPGFHPLQASVTRAQNLSFNAVRLRPAEGISVACLAPGASVTYSQPRKILGIDVLSSSTCAV